VLNRADVENAYAVIILADSSVENISQADDKTLLTILTIKAINQKVKVYAHALDQSNTGHMRRAKVDDIINNDQGVSFLLASHIISPGIPQLINELMDIQKGNNILRTSIPEEYIGKTVRELHTHFLDKKHVIFIGIVTEEEPLALGELLSGDVSYLDAFIERKLKEAGRGGNDKEKVHVTINPPNDYVIDKKDYALIIGGVN